MTLMVTVVHLWAGLASFFLHPLPFFHGSLQIPWGSGCAVVCVCARAHARVCCCGSKLGHLRISLVCTIDLWAA